MTHRHQAAGTNVNISPAGTSNVDFLGLLGASECCCSYVITTVIDYKCVIVV